MSNLSLPAIVEASLYLILAAGHSVTGTRHQNHRTPHLSNYELVVSAAYLALGAVHIIVARA